MLHFTLPWRTARPAPRFFDPDWYLQAYPDVEAAGCAPLRHYLRYGRYEGRSPCFLPSASRERDARWGLVDPHSGALTRLHQSPFSAADRVWATLASVRAEARSGNWKQAWELLNTLDPTTDIIHGFGDPDAALLGIEAAVVCGDLSLAHRLWSCARDAFGPSSDLFLSGANITAKQGGFGTMWHESIAEMYRRVRLPGFAVDPCLTNPSPFDRLVPAANSKRKTGPMVSVIVSARNAEHTLQTALRSLQDQVWRSLEILVVDNGSTDSTAQVAHQFAASDPRVRVLDGCRENGTYCARNLGASQARGAFITVLDADDWAHPHRISQQVRALQRAPGKVASLSHWVRCTQDLRFTRWWGEQGHVHPDISSLMIRAKAFDALGYWDRVRVGADTEYHARILARYGPHSVQSVSAAVPLSLGRVHAASLTQDPETHIETHINGARRDYRIASARWHRSRRFELPLTRHPDDRPFPVPASLAVCPATPSPDDDPLVTSGLYQDDWYMQTYPDVRARDADGLSHYRQVGEAEGRSPGPGFSASAYQAAYGPVEGSVADHYFVHGKSRGHAPLPVFKGALPPPRPGRHVLIFGHRAGAELFGAERCLPDLLTHAIADGMTPSVVLPQVCNRAYLETLRSRAHKVHVIPYGQAFGAVAPHADTLNRLQNLIRDSGAVAVHQNSIACDAPLIAARAVGVKTVLHVHELPAQDPRLCMDLGCHPEELRQSALRLADRIVAVSPAVATWLSPSPEQLYTLAPQIDPALASLTFSPGNPLRVGLIGSLTARKGLHDFLWVAKAAHRSGMNAQFLLVGSKSPDLARLSLPRNCRYCGYAESPVDAIAQVDIVMCLSQFAESYGLTVSEGLTAGRPIICYQRGTPPDLVGPDAGTVVPAGRRDLVLSALQRLVSDQQTLLNTSNAARRRGQHLAEMRVNTRIFHAG